MSLESILQIAVFPILLYLVKQNSDMRDRVIRLEERLVSTRDWLGRVSSQLGLHNENR